MNSEQVLASLGLVGQVADEMFVTQIGVLALTGLLFVASMALCIMAARAASSAKRTRDDVQGVAASMQDMKDEMRQLTAQIERASYTSNRTETEDGVSDAPATSGETRLAADEENIDPPSESDGANRAPSALFRGFLRRR